MKWERFVSENGVRVKNIFTLVVDNIKYCITGI